MKLFWILNIVTLATLTGCASHKIAPHPTEKQATTMLLAEAADTVSRSMVELVRIQTAATPPVYEQPLPDADIPELQNVANVDWAGPIEPLVKQLAQASQFKLRVLGKEPAVPILVTLNKKNTTIGSLLREVDYLANRKAHIKVFPQHQIIELRYGRN